MSYAAVRSLNCYRFEFVCRHSVRIFCSLNVRALQVSGGVAAEELVE